jgi:Sulfotransferase family
VQLVVVGFHRSGTSLLTQLLHRAGLFVGDKLLGALPSNPYGHYEDREVLEFHREVMDAHGVGWQVDGPQLFTLGRKHWAHMQDFAARRNAKHRIWGFKDPRVCFFLGPWKHIMPAAKFVIVYRDPIDCARSLESRHASDYLQDSGPADEHLRFFIEPDHALRMWDANNRAVVAFARNHVEDCIVLPTSALYSGYPVVAAINDRFGCDLDPVPTEAVFDPSATSQRTTAQWVHDGALLGRVERTWAELNRLSDLTEVR